MYTWKFGIVIFISLRQANDIKKKKKIEPKFSVASGSKLEIFQI